MNFLELARGYIRQARRRIKNADLAFKEKDYAHVVRQAQECVELSLKAALRFVAVDYPKVHDVSPALARVKEKFPGWFKEEIPFLMQASSSLAEKREPSMYGREIESISPEKLFDKETAERSLEDAKRVYALCLKLIKIKKRGK